MSQRAAGVPITHNEWLTANCNSGSREFKAFFWSPQSDTMNIHTCTCALPHNENKSIEQ